MIHPSISGFQLIAIVFSLAATLAGVRLAHGQDNQFQLARLGIVAKLGKSRESDDRELALMRELGVSIVVWTPGEWANNERKRSEYALAPEVKYVIGRIAAAQMRMVVVLFRKNDLYKNPLDPVAFAQYCRWLVITLKNAPVAAYQIWNEPSNFDVRDQYGGSWNGRGNAPWVSQFSKLMSIAAEAISRADPRATIIASFEGPPLLYAMQDHSDDFKNIEGISVHPYSGRFPAEQVPWGGMRIALRDGVSVADSDGSLVSTLRIQTRDFPRQYLGHGLEGWVTEYGFPTCDPASQQKNFACVAPQVQAAYHARGLLIGLAHGVNVWSPYELVDEGQNWSDAEQNFGLTGSAAADYAPKPAFFAIQRIAQVLGSDWQYLRRAPAVLELCPAQATCTSAAAGPRSSAVAGPQMVWFKEARGYAGFVWDAGQYHPGSSPGLIVWGNRPKASWRIRITNLVTGVSVPFVGSGQSASGLNMNVPVGSEPVLVEVSEK